MFCEKCGNKLNDGDKFCMKCGTAVANRAENQPQNTTTVQPENPAPAQPMYTAPVQPESQPQQMDTTSVQPESQPQQMNTTPVQPVNFTPVQPKAPKKPMSSKTKKIILFSSIGAGVVVIALIVLFAVVLPSMNRIDPSKYIKVDFDDASLYESYISGTVQIDSEAIYDEYIGEGKSSEDVLSDILSGDYSWSDLTSSASSVSSILQYCDVDVAVKGAEATEDKSTGNDLNSSATFENLKSGDTVVVTLAWDKSEEGKKRVEKMEKVVGVSFDKSDKTVEFKVSDELSKDALKVREPVKVDLFKYIDDNNLVKTSGISDGYITFMIDEFSFEEGGYTFEKDAESNTMTITDSDGTEHDIYLSNTYGYYLDDGDEMEIQIDYYSSSFEGNHLIDTDIFFTEMSKTYTVEANEAMTLERAKENLETIKTKAVEHLAGLSYSPVSAEIKEVYFSEAKSEDTRYQNKIIVVYRDKSEEKTYDTYIFKNVYMKDGEFCFEDTDTEFIWSADSVSKVKEKSSALKDDTYTTTKVG
ncbi:MAG: zinc-ribbon domain-containing protein [Ruminococcus sp.]|nr:zinc-ribbon domain-containing protein [Ruminococcus sp.]